jgi:hypothetical protein
MLIKTLLFLYATLFVVSLFIEHGPHTLLN